MILTVNTCLFVQLHCSLFLFVNNIANGNQALFLAVMKSIWWNHALTDYRVIVHKAICNRRNYRVFEKFLFPIDLPLGRCSNKLLQLSLQLFDKSQAIPPTTYINIALITFNRPECSLSNNLLFKSADVLVKSTAAGAFWLVDLNRLWSMTGGLGQQQMRDDDDND